MEHRNNTTVPRNRFEQNVAAGLAGIPPAEHTVRDRTLHETRRFRGLTVDQAMRYLESLGGTRTSATDVVGDGWRATVTADVVAVGPSYRLTEVTVSWTGDRAALERIILRFRLKAFRAPG